MRGLMLLLRRACGAVWLTHAVQPGRHWGAGAGTPVATDLRAVPREAGGLQGWQLGARLCCCAQPWLLLCK
jgi:hypothetical protein